MESANANKDDGCTDEPVETQAEDHAIASKSELADLQNARPEVIVIVATSALLTRDRNLAHRVTEMVNKSYGCSRLSVSETANRIGMGDKGVHANRVLHLAFRDGSLVGCCSSTIQPPWTASGCGHWGLMVVDLAAQGTGVASALRAAAEERLAAAECKQIQLEYEYTAGDPFSERLMEWYEHRCGFTCMDGRPRTRPGYTEFRRCRKHIDHSEMERAKQARPTTETGDLVDPASANTSAKPASCLSRLLARCAAATGL